MTGDGNGLPELPQGWVWTTIGEVTQPVEKVKPKENPDSQFTYLDISSIDNQINKVAEPKTYYGSEAPSRARQLVRANDVLFSTVRTYLKNIALVPEIHDGQIASTGFSVLRGESDISPKYLFYYSLTDQFINPLSELQRGTSYPAVRDSDVRTQSIPLPPLPEQQRIVAKIEELFTQLDAGVAALEKAKVQLRRYRQAVLKAAVEGELTREWREAHQGELEPAAVLLERVKEERKQQVQKRRKELPPVDESDLPRLPEAWVWARLGLCSELVTKGESPKWQGFDYVDDGIPFIRSENVRWGNVNFSGAVKIPEEFHRKLKRSQIRASDVLINLVGASIGRCGVVPPTISDANINQAVALIRVNDALQPSYLMYMLISPEMQKGIHGSKVETARPNISLGDLKHLTIPLPPAVEQQVVVEEIEHRLSVAGEMEKAVEQSLKRAERLRQSILKTAFEGNLVPQYTSDEPASVLLERIQAEKARCESKKKTRKRSQKKKQPRQLELL